MALTALEKFKLLKAGKPIPEDEITPKPSNDQKPKEIVKRIQRIEVFSPNMSPADHDSADEGKGQPNPKKLGEACTHPKDRIVSEYSPLIGTVRVCLDCGRQVNDKDLIS
ncbi:MAG: hypothetical protein WC346_02980 [Methanogenium sp.]|jgi:hypothetical protein